MADAKTTPATAAPAAEPKKDAVAAPAPEGGAAAAAAKKKKKKKPAKKDGAGAASAAAPAPAASSASAAAPAAAAADKRTDKPSGDAAAKKADAKADDKEKTDMVEVMYGARAAGGGRKKRDGKDDKDYVFWDTQPVPKLNEKPGEHGPIENKKLPDVMKDPYPLPAGFEWCSCDMNDKKTVDEVYKLLCENYVEDDDNMFRFDYSREFLAWALKPPGYRMEWHVGVRATKTKNLLAFITGVPADVRAYKREMKMVEINFLCVHKQLRSKRLAPVLIKEITRRVNLRDIWQAVYTAGVVLPKPVAQNRYYHRSLNPKKLIEIGFSRLQPRMTLARTIKLYKLPAEPQTKGLRAMEAKDVPEACALLTNYLKKFSLVQEYNNEEFAHWLMPRENVVYTYVVEDPTTKKLTDMLSFYVLPSTVIGNAQHNSLRAAYSFYNVATKTSWETLMTDALILARSHDFDVFNALNVMENDAFLKTLKFGIGDGHLQYYLYNWRCPEMQPKDVGLVLL